MTTTSQIPAIIDYLVNSCQQSTALGAAAGTAKVIVIDGPPLTTDTFADKLHLYIGGNPDTDVVTATAVQAWPVMDSARTRDEDGDITLTADAWVGSSVMKTARDACAAIVAAVELLLRGTLAVGGPGDATMGGLAMWSSVDGPYSWTQRQTQQGAGCSCEFRITYRARLTTS
jgi:hypothetical protein